MANEVTWAMWLGRGRAKAHVNKGSNRTCLPLMEALVMTESAQLKPQVLRYRGIATE